MVDPIGIKTVATQGRTVQAVTPLANVSAPAAVSRGAEAPAPALTTLARAMSEDVPVDYQRVAEIRRAIAEGSYPIDANKVADRMMAEARDWGRGSPELDRSLDRSAPRS